MTVSSSTIFRRTILQIGILLFGLSFCPSLLATPANRAGLERYYDRFLSRDLNRCHTCHLPNDKKDPQDLSEFPHNTFGSRLKEVSKFLSDAGKPNDLTSRLKFIATEDSDGDGVPNELEILLGSSPGDPKDKPDTNKLSMSSDRQAVFARFLNGYRWRPFESVHQPAIPKPVC